MIAGSKAYYLLTRFLHRNFTYEKWYAKANETSFCYSSIPVYQSSHFDLAANYLLHGYFWLVKGSVSTNRMPYTNTWSFFNHQSYLPTYATLLSILSNHSHGKNWRLHEVFVCIWSSSHYNVENSTVFANVGWTNIRVDCGCRLGRNTGLQGGLVH